MIDLFPIRDFIAANSDNASELRARWQNDSAQPRKESTPVNTATSNFLSELVSEQIEINDSVTRKAKSEADDAERVRIKSRETDLKRHFAKLIEKGEASVIKGEMYFDYAGSRYIVVLKDGSFRLHIGATVLATFNHDGDAVQTLAKVLSKLKAPDSNAVEAPQVSPEQVELSRLRDVTKRYVGVLDELKTVSR
jgi:hypothetical protein